MDTWKTEKEIAEEKFKSAGCSTLDSKKRITIGSKILKEEPLNHMEVNAFEIFIGDEGDILLKPMANIPSRELWIYQNPEVIKSIQKGLQDVREGRVAEVKDVKKFLKDL